jgi:hypothetical protein
MSGGFIKPQKQFEHQLVVFTFIGPVTQKQVDQWNDALAELKQMFGPTLTGITIKGDPTPTKYQRMAKKKKK